MKFRYIFIFCLICFNTNIFAFKFSPMSATIKTKGSESSTLFALENDSDLPIAIQVSLAKREMDINGKENNPKLSNEISVYPNQLIIPAHEKRSVKVFWTGKIDPKKEFACRLIAEQLPIDLEKSKNQKTSIKVLLRYIAALYVQAEDASSNISIKKISTKDKKLLIEVENSGKKHQVLTNLNLQFKHNNKDILFSSSELKGISGENVLAETTRIFTLPLEGKFLEINSTDPVKLKFDND